MTGRSFYLGILLIIIISFAVAFLSYPLLPDEIVSHWNAAGQADGTMPKEIGAFFLPLIGAGLAILLVLVQKIDPLKKNVKEFIEYYNLLIVSFLSFLIYLQILITIANFGQEFNMVQLMAPAFGLLIFVVGVLIGKTKKNYFIGIRTPWTLADEKTWEATHKIGAKLFKASGIIAIIGFVFVDFAIWFLLTPIIFSAIYTTIYSYHFYRKKHK